MDLNVPVKTHTDNHKFDDLNVDTVCRLWSAAQDKRYNDLVFHPLQIASYCKCSVDNNLLHCGNFILILNWTESETTFCQF